MLILMLQDVVHFAILYDRQPMSKFVASKYIQLRAFLSQRKYFILHSSFAMHALKTLRIYNVRQFYLSSRQHSLFLGFALWWSKRHCIL